MNDDSAGGGQQTNRAHEKTVFGKLKHPRVAARHVIHLDNSMTTQPSYIPSGNRVLPPPPVIKQLPNEKI